MKADFRTNKEVNDDQTKSWLFRISLPVAVTAVFFLSGCANFNAAAEEGLVEIAAESMDEAFYRAERGSERLIAGAVGRVIRGGKPVNINNVYGCMDNIVVRSDGGKINGEESVLIRAGTSREVKLQIGTPSRDREVVLIAIPTGSVPPGCDRVRRDYEEFRWDYRYDDWRIRN